MGAAMHNKGEVLCNAAPMGTRYLLQAIAWTWPED